MNDYGNEFIRVFLNDYAQESPRARRTSFRFKPDNPSSEVLDLMDAGIILKKPIKLTDIDLQNFTTDQLEEMRILQNLPNVEIWESRDLGYKQYLIESNVPVITTMAA